MGVGIQAFEFHKKRIDVSIVQFYSNTCKHIRIIQLHVSDKVSIVRVCMCRMSNDFRTCKLYTWI